MTDHLTISTAEQIKKATAHSHAGTEKALIKHIKSIHTISGYASLLYCMYGYFAPLEQRFDALVAKLVPDHHQRRKAAKVTGDLRTLGHGPPQHLSEDLPDIHNGIQALACCYVLEGSTLGGTIIRRLISDQCAGIPSQAFSFFSGYGDNSMAMWRSFLANLNASIVTPTDTQLAIDAANSCFIKFGRWIDHYYARYSGGLQ